MTAKGRTSKPGTGLDRRAIAAQLGPAVAGILPRSQQVVLGWLMVCETPEQTQADIKEALGLSTGAVSNALRVLTEAGMVEKTAPGDDRTARYRFPQGAWAHALELGVTRMEESVSQLQGTLANVTASGDLRATQNVREFVAHFEHLVGVMRQIADDAQGSAATA